MKKIFYFLLIFFCILIFFSCTKNEINIENDIEQCKLLEGTWTQTRLTEVAIRNDETNLEFITGFAEYNTFTSVTFDANQNMRTKISNELVSYEFESDEYELSQEELDLYFNQKIIIDANYVASKENIQYENTQISINDSDFISYDEYMQINPQVKNNRQILSWKIENNKLILTMQLQKEKIETEYYRVSQ